MKNKRILALTAFSAIATTLAFFLFFSEKGKNIDMRKMGELHDKSYSQSLDYYKGLTELMRDIRKSVQSFVLEGKEVESFDISVIGPSSISGPMLSPLPKESAILDVGSATGDTLVLMQEEGYKNLTGIDVASGMVKEAQKHQGIQFIQADFLEFSPSCSYDLVYAQALVHLFPKKMFPEILQKLLDLSNRRLYFTTTVHETPGEGVELKNDVYRYRSRYTSEEIISQIRELLKNDPHLCFYYFYLTDPLGKRWINCIIEKKEIRQMKVLAINTANSNKLKEFERLFAKHQILLQPTCADVPEIQSDPIMVVVHKASQAGEGVLIEDTSLEIEQASVGVNIRWQLDNLPKYIGRKAVWKVLLAYQQKGQVYIYEGKINGQIVSPKGDRTFGFDPFFLPEGSKYTLGESKPDSVNARAKAVEAFVLEKPISIHAPLFEWEGPWQ